MGLLDLASGNSFWRGYDYYEAGKVKTSRQTGELQYEGTVEGSNSSQYDVMLENIIRFDLCFLQWTFKMSLLISLLKSTNQKLPNRTYNVSLKYTIDKTDEGIK